MIDSASAKLMLKLRPWWFPAVALGLFEWYARTVGKSSDAIAPPSAALSGFTSAISDGSLLSATAFTLGSAVLGLLLAAVLGIAAGIALGLSPRAARLSFLSIEVFRPIPSVALIPLSMLVFGFGLRMEFSIVAFACFWPLLLLSQAAVQQVEPRLLEVSQVLGLSPLQRATKIILPAHGPSDQRMVGVYRLKVKLGLVGGLKGLFELEFDLHVFEGPGLFDGHAALPHLVVANPAAAGTYASLQNPKKPAPKKK